MNGEDECLNHHTVLNGEFEKASLRSNCLKRESKLIIQVKSKEKVITDKRNSTCEGPEV